MSSKIIRLENAEQKEISTFQLGHANRCEVVVPTHDPPPPLPTRPSEPPPVSDLPEKSNAQLEQTRSEAEKIIQAAQAQATAIEKEAYERGFGEGEKAGRETGEKMAEAILKQYAARLEELTQLRKSILSGSEHEVVRLALEIAKKVVKREVNIDNELILTMVKVALNRLAEQTAATIRVNPQDYRLMTDRQSAHSARGSANDGIKLIEDPMISRGGALIETESGIIDARIEEQFREIQRGFFD
jgi:flagellar biosynthesis/type III secretory pathway protein FliH